MTDRSKLVDDRRRPSMWDAIDSTLLVYLRIVLAASTYLWADQYLDHDHYVAAFGQARFQFKYPGFEWVGLWSDRGIYWHFVVAKLFSVLLAFGCLTRISAGILCFLVTYVLLVERAIYADFDYLIACLAGLMVWLPAGRRYALDTWLGIETRSDRWRRWQLSLIRFQFALPYWFSAIAKLDGDWLRGQPIELMLRSRFSLVGEFNLHQVSLVIEAISYGSILIELLLIPGMLSRVTRPIAVTFAILLHLTNAFLLNAGSMPWLLLATLVVFFPVAWLPKRIGIWLGRDQPVGLAAPLASVTRSRFARIGFVAAIVYAIIQFMLPWRPYIYPGNVDWNQRGDRFAWRWMLTDRRAMTHFLVVDRTNGQSIVLPSTRFITSEQARLANQHPELIRQTACYLAALARAELRVTDSEVYALALVSLNGRRPKPVVDPSIDLTRVQRGYWRDDWITSSAGPFLDPPWLVNQETWWKAIDLPPRYESALQGRTPAELQADLDRLAR